MKIISYILAFCILASQCEARYGSSQYRRYVQQQQQAYQAQVHFQQQMLMQAMIRQAAINKERAEMLSKARKSIREREEQHHQEMVRQRKEKSSSGLDTVKEK
jgi:hypothetical protein